ncbi:caspase family protein [Kitasatospora mediocidica]|uniref:caspase family protein n=1 Tax=Kitasatospora mediocidica TaxID=58352 RepID=UPI00068AC504|nr:caspase family protein [Kitasatospora mediocidica]
MTKRAVIVGINDYSGQNNPNFTVGNLSGCVADANSMKDMLTSTFGFDQISSFLTDGAATSAAIKSAVGDMLSASSAGDVAVLCYAGHGGRLPQDMTNPGGRFYECIIPASGDLITDRDFYSMADNLDQSTVNFTLIMDSCNSGGLHEGTPDSLVRSGDYSSALVQACVGSMTTVIPCGVTLPPDSTAMDGNVSNVTGQGNGVVCSVDDNKSFVPLSKSTVLAACRYDESDADNAGGNGHGGLTQGLLDVFNQSDPQVTYRQVVDRLRTDMQGIGLTQTATLLGQQNRMDENFLAPWTTSA